MCTSIVVNKRKTLIGWNLDILDMEYRVRTDNKGVFIEINDAKEGWMPLFGANSRGDFVGMPNFGSLDFWKSDDGLPVEGFLIFQTFFCATAATSVSGCMAERTKFSMYLV